MAEKPHVRRPAKSAGHLKEYFAVIGMHAVCQAAHTPSQYFVVDGGRKQRNTRWRVLFEAILHDAHTCNNQSHAAAGTLHIVFYARVRHDPIVVRQPKCSHRRHGITVFYRA